MTFDLLQESANFAQTVQDLLDAVLPPDPSADIEHRRLNVIQQDPWFVIRPGTQTKIGVIHLLSSGEHVANLSLTFKCGPDRVSRFLAVRKSSFQLQWLGEGPPLMRLDFDHNSHTVPVSHWNVHAERGATVISLTSPLRFSRTSSATLFRIPMRAIHRETETYSTSIEGDHPGAPLSAPYPCPEASTV